MTGVTTGQTSLATATDSDDVEAYSTGSLVSNLQALANLFESATGHDHTGAGKGKPIGSAGIASGITLTSPVVSGPLSLTDAASRIVPGVTSLSLRNNANNADNLLITDAGVATLRGLPLNLPGQSGGVAKAIAWADAGAGLTSILGNTVGGAPASNVLRFDIATGTVSSSVTALTLDGAGTVSSGVGGFNSGSGTDVAGGGAVATLPTIGGTGPATAASQGWMRIKIGGFARWVPFWA